MEKKVAAAVKMAAVAQKAPATETRTGEGKKKLPNPLEVQLEKKHKQKHKKMNSESYKCNILKVLMQVHPDVGISSEAMLIMNGFVNDIFDNLGNEAWKLAKYSKKDTVTSREIQAAAKLIIPGELSKHAVNEGIKAVAKFIDSD